MSIYLPNNGRLEGRVPPSSIDHLFPDPNKELDIVLVVSKSALDPPEHAPRDFHWKLAWELGRVDGGHIVYRRINIVREIGADHLTNWGTLTKIEDVSTIARSKTIKVAKLSLAQRKKLEEIGEETPVRKPDGRWNCQDWIMSVVEVAERKGLLERDVWLKVVAEARKDF